MSVPIIMLIPASAGVGLPTVAQGLARAFAYQGVRAHVCAPIDQHSAHEDSSTALSMRTVEKLLSQGARDKLLEKILRICEQASANQDLLIVQSLLPTDEVGYATRMNMDICTALDAKVIIVAKPGQLALDAFEDVIQLTARHYGGLKSDRLLGCVVNKIGEPVDERGYSLLEFTNNGHAYTEQQQLESQCPLFRDKKIPLLGLIPWQPALMSPRVKDVARFLDAQVINAGEAETRRINRIALCARSVTNMAAVLQPGTLIITAGDRSDIIVATCLAALSGVPIAALLLTGGYPIVDDVLMLCEQAFQQGLPVLSVKTNSFQTAIALQALDREIPADDETRRERMNDATAEQIRTDWMSAVLNEQKERHLSPPAFRYQLVEKARQAQKTIVLPEGEEPRTLVAAARCVERGIARCVLLGNPETMRRIAEQQGVNLGEGVRLVDPATLVENYVDAMVLRRKHKGLSAIAARHQLEDPVVLGTMMLAEGDVDGLVSGAEHTTADTIRPALQLIKTAPGAQLVSSIFFMCLPDQVLVYGDCAVNPDPNVNQLADIAIQSADSAKAFGITPRVAMLSYSTGTSGQGQDVEKVREATARVKAQRPDIEIDGPLQYDAALNPRVAKAKAPNSPVAGRATVFIFPDLNTGNTTYKAVQRSTGVLSIGPMLQGMAKPVNDLSRGASIEDIVYTIALTAIQALA